MLKTTLWVGHRAPWLHLPSLALQTLCCCPRFKLSALPRLLITRRAPGGCKTSLTWEPITSRIPSCLPDFMAATRAHICKEVAAAKEKLGWSFGWCKVLHFCRARGSCPELPCWAMVLCWQGKTQEMHLSVVNGVTYSSSGLEQTRFSLVPGRAVWPTLL